jgi:hypothetical protein
MEDQALTKNDILHFNIGGYKTDIMRSTIEQFGGSYLTTLISDKFGVIRDHKGRIFIDRPKEEGKLIAYFIRTQQLPMNLDETVARLAADYFGLESMLNMLDKHWPKMSGEKFIKFNRSDAMQCPECNVIKMRDAWRFDKAKEHLTSHHQAEILQSKVDEYYKWKIIYRIPVQ